MASNLLEEDSARNGAVSQDAAELRPKKAVYVALLLVTCSIIALEVSWMRLFSISIWHHFAYMVIAIAMVGFGAAGALPYFAPQIRTVSTEKILGASSRLFSILTILSLLILSRVTLDFLDVLRGGSQRTLLFRSLIGCYALQFATFFFGGLYVMTTISRYPKYVNGLYCMDLLGAASGCVIAVVGLHLITGPQMVLATACLVAVAAVIASPKWKPGFAWTALIVVVAAVIWFFFPVRFAVSPGKHLALLNPGDYEEKVEFTRWNSLGRIDVTKETEEFVTAHYSPVIRELFGGITPHKYIFYDGTVMSPIYRCDGDVSKLEFIPYGLHSLPYNLVDDPRVLVIGVGGGIDILTAKYHGAKLIKGVELNPITLGLITKEYMDYTGGVFLTDEVSLVEAEGRNYISRAKDETYDLIQLTGVDTITGLSSGAYALSENFLYTVEAFGDYMSRLSDGGLLSFVRVRFKFPRETLRLVTTAMEAHRRGTCPNPKTNLMIVDGGDKVHFWGAFLLKKSPFTKEEVERVRAAAARAKFDLMYDPFGSYDNEFWRFLNAPDPDKFISDYWYNVQPATDNQPYFFQYYKWKNLFKWRPLIHGYEPWMPIQLSVILALTVELLVLMAVFILLPLYRYQKDIQAGLKGKILGYFFCLGIGFMLIEIVAMQKFTLYLGTPIWAIAVVLFTLLFFSGLGSFVGRAINPRGKLIGGLLVLIAVWVTTFTLVSGSVFRATLGLGFPQRIIITMLLLGPLGFLMGMPFPTGIRVLSDRASHLIPIAWGANACSSTLGSVLSTMLGVSFGFHTVFVIAALVYLAAWFFIKGTIRAGTVVRTT